MMKKIDKKTIFLIGTFFFLLLYFFLFFFGIVNFFNIKAYLVLLFLFGSIIFLPSFLYKSPEEYINRINKHITNFMALSLSIFFSLVFIEGSLHIVKPPFLETNFSVSGDFTDFTSRGYLDKEVFNKPKEIFRILGLGDSFAENSRETNKNYHNFLQQMFDMVYEEKKVEVINAGISCTGPGYYWHILEKYGDSIKPDLVLIGFFVGNDFNDTNFDQIQRGWYIVEPRDTKKRILGYLRFKNFWLYQFLWRKGIEIRDIKKIDEELSNGIVKEKGCFSEESFLRIEKDRMGICENIKKYDLEKLWVQNSKVIFDIKNWCDKRNIELLIAIFPDQFQIEQDLLQKILKKYNLQEDQVDLRYPNKLILDFCKKNNIHYVDLLESFQEQSKFLKLYLIRETHWNEKGNKLAARIIFDYIENNNLVESK